MRVLVLGAARSGVAAAKLARRLDHRVVVYDADAATTTPLVAAGFAVTTGAWSSDLLEGMDLVVTSPGFSERSVPVVETLERGLPLWSEIEFAWRHLGVPVVAVTGTNGKTTVTGLVADMLGRSGRHAEALGNIGHPLSDAVGERLDVAAVEVSSFQLRFTEAFHPEVAVVLNVAPDHLDWHGSFDAYTRAKGRILANQDAGDLVVFDADDEGATHLVAGAPSRHLPVSGSRVPTGGGGVGDGYLVVGPLRLALDRLAVRDPSFLVDLAAAAAAALEAGATVEGVEEACLAFRPGPHRRTVVAERAGVRFVDDSKATNLHAALASIRSYPSVVLIAGGLAKGLDLSPLAAEANVRRIVAIGSSAASIAAAAPDLVCEASSMEQAVEAAARCAAAGDTVLLAPACASFDMFTSYADRGDRFAAAVLTILGEER